MTNTDHDERAAHAVAVEAAEPRTRRGGALHLLPHQGVWGTGRFVIEFTRHERMDGGADEIVLTERALDVDHDFMAPAIPVHHLGLEDEPLRTRARRVADLAEARGLDSIVCYAARDLALASHAARRAGAFGAAHLLDGPPTSAGLIERVTLRRAARRLDDVACASPALARAWSAAGVDARVVPPAVDVQRYSPGEQPSSWRAARLPDPRTLLVGTLMRAEEGKRHDVLIDAALRRHAEGRPTALMMVGDGPGFPVLKERCRGSDVLFARRRVLDSPGFFQRIDAFALHAEGERAPLSLLESMACGRAAVVADDGAVADLVGPDVALFTGIGDVEATVAAFDRLADSSERSALGQAARARAVDRHNLGKLRAEIARSRPRGPR